MKQIMKWLAGPTGDGPASTILLRLMAGGVFFWEGVLKFVYIVGGLMLLLGFMTRLIAVLFVVEMLVAMLSTNISMYLGTSPLPLPPAPPQIGIWAVLHEIRSEYAQLLTVLFLGINGPGAWSLDAVWHRASETHAGRREPLASVRSAAGVRP